MREQQGAQPPQSLFLALNRSVSADVARLVLWSSLPPGLVYVRSFALNVKSGRLKVPSSRLAFSQTGMCGSMFFSLTIQFSKGAAPYAVSPTSRLGFN